LRQECYSEMAYLMRLTKVSTEYYYNSPYDYF
jgi:hypothetical protein